ncbi:hypothetical protein [Haloarcula sp. 1CSR25-25]|nr:hypothetical protein [Haloarcula sp. 1CSR25-25]MDT3435537.1 hypothetical protein [Haloarcula sp. 1CSR25-25]
MGDDEHTRTGDGRPKYCVQCGDPYREIQRLPGLVNQCPTCFEDVLNGS